MNNKGKESVIKKQVAGGLIMLACIATIGFMLACALPQHKVIPMEQSKYSFKGFEIPERKPAGSIPITIAVVRPSYKEIKRGEYNNVLKSYSDFFASSLDEIIVAKGMTVKGPYDSLEEMPFPDKKGTDLTFTQTVYILPNDKRTVKTGEYFAESGGQTIFSVFDEIEMSVEVWVTFEMREPLSGEKMWVKKLEFGEINRFYEVIYERGEKGMKGRLLYNAKVDAYHAYKPLPSKYLDRPCLYIQGVLHKLLSL